MEELRTVAAEANPDPPVISFTLKPRSLLELMIEPVTVAELPRSQRPLVVSGPDPRVVPWLITTVDSPSVIMPSVTPPGFTVNVAPSRFQPMGWDPGATVADCPGVNVTAAA
jgi:hypothetical protein